MADIKLIYDASGRVVDATREETAGPLQQIKDAYTAYGTAKALIENNAKAFVTTTLDRSFAELKTAASDAIGPEQKAKVLGVLDQFQFGDKISHHTETPLLVAPPPDAPPPFVVPLIVVFKDP